MPSLTDLEFAVSPLADPYGYPGVAVDADYLWLDSWMYPIAASGGGDLSRWRVPVDSGPLATGGAGPVVSLGEALELAGAAPIDTRYPVVSFGSNSAPAQLRDKFAGLDPPGTVVPVVRGAIEGLSLGHSPHVSGPGYLPYVLVDDGSTGALPVFVLWLDPAALAVMNRTEPNYDLVGVPSARFPLTLGTGERVNAYSVYKGKWGALRSAGRGGPLVAGSQQEVFDHLNRASWFRSLAGSGDVRAQMARFRAHAELRQQVRHELAARGWATTDGWAADAPQQLPSSARSAKASP